MDLINKSEYSLEFNEVIEYMSSTLFNEFPTDVLTLEYLILAVLDNRNCHANMILDNCLMSNNIDELRKIYISVIGKYVKPQLKPANVSFGEEIIRVLECSKKEAEKLNNKPIGTEHFLLAILNKENHFMEANVFSKFRLEYDFIFGKCNAQRQSQNESKAIKTPKRINKKNEAIPLKSQINTKTVSSKEKNDFINDYTVNLNKLAEEGKLDELVGRKNEINEILKILSRRKKNNAVLIGEGGVGKTAIVNGLANMIVNNDVPNVLEGKEIIMLNAMALVSGTHFRGMFEERVNGLFTELKRSTKYILFIDDIHTIMKGGNKEKDGDISGMVSEILSEGAVKIIATTTFKDYRNTIENNSSLSRKFQKVVIEAPSTNETIDIINNNKKYYEDYHNVVYSEKSIKKAVELAERYIADRALPDSALDIIDLAGANTSIIDREPIEIQNIKNRIKEIEDEKDNALNNGEFEIIDSLNTELNVLNSDVADFKRLKKDEYHKIVTINENDIANVVSEITNIPVAKLSVSEKEKVLHIDEVLKKSIVGQDEAIDEICKVIKRNKVGLGGSNTNNGVFLLCGKSGTGKTLLAKKIAEEIYGSEKSLIRLDMSEYSEKNSVSKLYGSAPGYIGYDDGGVLTNLIKQKPYSVVLLDEIEKADESIYNLFLQVFDEGRLTESNGNIVDCRNCIFIMTSNIGARKAAELGNGLGFTNNEEINKKSIIEKEIKRKFTPEFINRINKIVYFNNLTDDNLKNIVKLEINKLNKKLNNIEYSIEYNNDVVDFIHSKAIKEKELGARPIIRLIQTNMEDKITELMLENDYPQHYVFHASCINDEINVC